MVANQIGEFNYKINGTLLMKGYVGSFRNLYITYYISLLYYLGPLNLFLYTCCFLRELQQSATNKVLKQIYRWFAIISIAVLPLAFYSLVSAWIYFAAT
jgi:hypothetical protein